MWKNYSENFLGQSRSCTKIKPDSIFAFPYFLSQLLMDFFVWPQVGILPCDNNVPSFTNELRFGDNGGRSSDEDETLKYGLNKFPFDVDADSAGMSTFSSEFESPPPLEVDEFSCTTVGADICRFKIRLRSEKINSCVASIYFYKAVQRRARPFRRLFPVIAQWITCVCEF